MKQTLVLSHVQGIIISLFIVIFKISANAIYEQYVPCNPGWYFFGEKCYKIFPNNSETGYGWVESANQCVSHGGYLVSIHSNELQEFLTKVLLLNSKTNAWIGLHDRVSESDFTWVDGSSYDYRNWDEKEPSRRYSTNEEDCVEMRYYNYKEEIGKWNDDACNSLRPYICQVDKNEDLMSPDPKFCSLEDGGGWKSSNSCYHVVMEEKSWEDAEKYCEEKYNSYLVSVLQPKAEIFLDYILKVSNISQSIWIGINMKNNSMQKWMSGWHVTYKNNLEFLYLNDTCVAKSNWGSWIIVPCKNKYPFICEKMKYNIPVLQRPPSDNWKCPETSEKWIDLGGDSCYFVENGSSKNWMDANYECGKKGGTLASIHSENETNLLHPHVLETQERLLIGLKRVSKNVEVQTIVHPRYLGVRRPTVKSVTEEHEFEWADGTNISYQNWHGGEPNSISEKCGELWTDSMKWNDIPCGITKGYICKTKKVFFHSNMEEVLHHASCKSAFSQDLVYSGGVPAGIMVGILLLTLLVGIFAGVIIYHFQDYWMGYCSKTERNGYTSTDKGSLGDVSDKVIWKQQEEEISY